MSVGKSQAALRFLETTDVHGHVLPYDYHLDEPRDTFGLSRIASLVRECRAGPHTTLLLDNGDFIQGTPLTETVAEGIRRGWFDCNPIISVMNAMGYDAATLGNHEFNYGLDHLRRALRDASFPVTSANVHPKDENRAFEELLFPWVILEREVNMPESGPRPIRIGVIGFSPPQLARWDAQSIQGKIETSAILDAARAQVPRLRNAGADIVVALCHSGVGTAEEEKLGENVGRQLAEIDGIDALLLGHDHRPFPHPGTGEVKPTTSNLGNKPALNAGAKGAWLGCMDLLLELGETGDWRVADHRCQLLRVGSAQVASDAGIAAIIGAAHKMTLDRMRTPIGETRVSLHTYFSRLIPDNATAFVAEAQRREVAKFVNDSTNGDRTILSAVAPFKSGGRGGPENYADIEPGPIEQRHVTDLYTFPNTLCAVEIDGSGLIEWLEQAASSFCRIIPGAGQQPLFDERVPGYYCDVIDGAYYDIDLSQPARYAMTGEIVDPGASRIRNLRVGRHPVTRSDKFIVAVNSFRVGSGGNISALRRAKLLYHGQTRARDALQHLLQDEGPITCRAGSAWQLAPIPGATAVFRTGPGALAHLGDLHPYPVIGHSTDTDGFLLCEIDLNPSQV